VSPSVFRRFNSDDARPVEAADGEQGAVQSAIDSAAEPSRAEARSFFDDEPRERRVDSGRRGETDRPFTDRRGASMTLTPTPGVYIGNLLFDVTAADLEKEFASFGAIKSARVVTDANGTSKG
jgi:nucleolin